MPALYTHIGPWTFPTFTLALALGVLVSLGLGLRRSQNPGFIADACLGALIGAVLAARLFHVLLNWDYFAENVHEAVLLNLGGLDWHGAVIGGLLGLYVAWRVRRVVGARYAASPHLFPRFVDLVDSLTPALPLIGLAAWWGCLAAACGYGLEVDNLSNYSAFVAAETADVFGIAAPRYNTQLFGLLLSAAVLLVVALLFWRGWLHYRRFWLTLALLSLGMFVIGFYRGDHVVRIAGFRADQLLDAMLFVIAGVIGARRPVRLL